MASLGVLLRAMDRTPEAIGYYRRALAVLEAAVGPEHPRVASLHYNLGLALDDDGDRAGAIVELRRAVALREQALGADHPTTVTAREALEARLVPASDAPAAGEAENGG